MDVLSDRVRQAFLSAAIFVAMQQGFTPLQAAPKATSLFPAGAACGETIDVAVSGEFPSWPVEVWSDHSGVTAIADADRKGHLFVSVAANAELGVALLRLYDREGTSALRPFIVGALPEVLELEPNDAPSSAQQVAATVVANGRLQRAGDVDCYLINLQQGETVVAALQANSILGSPVDAVLQICERVERQTFSSGSPAIEAYPIEQNHDAFGLDPRVVYKAPHAGVYLVRVFGFASQPDANIGFAGGENFIYRLTLTKGPFAVAAMPLAVTSGQQADVSFIGWNLAAEHHVPLLSNATSATRTERRPVAFHRGVAGSVPLIAVDLPTTVATESSAEHPQDVAVPVVISGQLERPREINVFRFSATKDQKLRLSVDASSLGSPFDPHLSIFDEQGKLLAENDDVNDRKDPELLFSPPADGQYQVRLRDLSRGGDLTYVYRLQIAQIRPDFVLTPSTDVFTLEAGKPLEIALSIDRRDALAQPIAIAAEGLPAGVVADSVVSQPMGESAKSVKLVLRSTSTLSSPVSAPFRIRGTAEGELSHRAAVSSGFPFGGDNDNLWLTVRP